MSPRRDALDTGKSPKACVKGKAGQPPMPPSVGVGAIESSCIRVPDLPSPTQNPTDRTQCKPKPHNPTTHRLPSPSSRRAEPAPAKAGKSIPPESITHKPAGHPMLRGPLPSTELEAEVGAASTNWRGAALVPLFTSSPSPLGPSRERGIKGVRVPLPLHHAKSPSFSL